ncbi:MAG TPA: hypothetical protein ACFE0H_06530, partial [Elainellaceae cyanobacterium]
MLGLLLLIAAAGVVGLIHVGQIRLAIAGVILGIIMSLSMCICRPRRKLRWCGIFKTVVNTSFGSMALVHT